MPLKEKVTELGRKDFYSPKMWYLGNSPYSLKGSNAVAELIVRSYFYTAGSRKKCLAVDLDNTLWGGVIGEDGVDGLILSNHKEGARYYDTQKCLKRMKERGVMLAILSKNNLEDVSPVFSHPFMLLKEDDFVGQKINWNPKPTRMAVATHNFLIIALFFNLKKITKSSAGRIVTAFALYPNATNEKNANNKSVITLSNVLFILLHFHINIIIAIMAVTHPTLAS